MQRFIENYTFYTQTDLTANVDTGGIEHSMALGVSALWEDYSQYQGSLPRNPDGSTPIFPLVSISDPGAIAPVRGRRGGKVSETCLPATRYR